MYVPNYGLCTCTCRLELEQATIEKELGEKDKLYMEYFMAVTDLFETVQVGMIQNCSHSMYKAILKLNNHVGYTKKYSNHIIDSMCEHFMVKNGTGPYNMVLHVWEIIMSHTHEKAI